MFHAQTAVNFHEFSALPIAPGVVPIEFSPTLAPLSFVALLGDMWRSIYPLEDPPHYQVFQFSVGGRIREYVAHVHLSAPIPVGKRTYSFHGGYGANPERVVQLAAMAGVTGLRHQESMVQENRAYQYYPTIAENPRRIQFPSVNPQDDMAILAMSRYMTAKCLLIPELVRDAIRARRLLGVALPQSPPASPTPLPRPSGVSKSAVPLATPLASSPVRERLLKCRM